VNDDLAEIFKDELLTYINSAFVFIALGKPCKFRTRQRAMGWESNRCPQKAKRQSVNALSIYTRIMARFYVYPSVCFLWTSPSFCLSCWPESAAPRHKTLVKFHITY